MPFTTTPVAVPRHHDARECDVDIVDLSFSRHMVKQHRRTTE